MSTNTYLFRAIAILSIVVFSLAVDSCCAIYPVQEKVIKIENKDSKKLHKKINIKANSSNVYIKISTENLLNYVLDNIKNNGLSVIATCISPLLGERKVQMKDFGSKMICPKGSVMLEITAPSAAEEKCIYICRIEFYDSIDVYLDEQDLLIDEMARLDEFIANTDYKIEQKKLIIEALENQQSHHVRPTSSSTSSLVTRGSNIRPTSVSIPQYRQPSHLINKRIMEIQEENNLFHFKK